MLQLDEIIGRGGFGTVYRGTLRSEDGLTRRVAVKVLADELSGDEGAVGRLRDEARLLALLDHPALVPVYAMQQVDHRWALVMGLVDGVDLRELLKRGLAVPAAAAAEVGIEVAEALSAMWEQLHPETGEPLHVVHRDIKPQNIMVDAGGRVRLLDLGVASARFEARESATRGGVAGTLAYMSPQRWARSNDAHKGDVYALGATLFHLVWGKLPPEAGPDAQAHAAAVDEALAKLPERARGLAPAIRAALTFDDVQRPDGNALAGLLREVMPGLEGPGMRELAAEVVPEALEARRARVRDAGPTLSGSSWDVLSTTASSDPLETGWIFSEDHDLKTPPTLAPWPSPKARRLALVGIGGAGVAAALALGSGPTASSGPALSLVVPPVHPAELMAVALEPLRSHLQTELDQPVELVVASSYGDTRERYSSGEADLTLLTPLLFVQALALGPVSTLAMTDPVVMSGHEGVLLVARDVAELDDLRGSTICFTDPNSTSGFLLPRRYLRKNGLAPDRDYSAHISGGHSQVVQDLADGVCRAAGTFGNAFADAVKHDATNGAQVFARTGLAAHNTVACGVGRDADQCARISEALLRFHPGEAGSDAFRINGFVAHDPEVFQDLVDAWADENPAGGG